MDTGRLLTAMITPFTPDNRIDIEGVHTVVNHLIHTGTTSIVVCGTTGESPTLSHDEKLLLIKETVKAVGGRIPVIAGTGNNDTGQTVTLSREVAGLGVDGLMLVTPYYNRPSQAGLLAHFSAVANAVDLPVMLYNVPSRTGCRLEVPAILELASIPNVFSIKEASGDLAHIMRLCSEKPDDFLVYSGDDKLTLPILSVGGVGVVSVAAHIAGQEMSVMVDLFMEGKVAEAAAWNGRLLPLFDAMFHPSSASPAQVKYAASLLGLCADDVRLPLTRVPSDVAAAISDELSRLRKLPAMTHSQV